MTLDWTPSFPLVWLGIIALLVVLIALYSLWRRLPGLIWRSLAVLLIIGWLSGPHLLHPVLHPQPQDALIVVDQSPSMEIKNRHSLADHAARQLSEQAQHLPNLHLHYVDASGGNGRGTRLFETIEREALNVPNLAGVFLLTDGMNHDTPAQLPTSLKDSSGRILPLHVLLTAKGEEIDRRLRVLSSPPYVLLGQEAHIRLQVDDLGASPGKPVDIMEHLDDGRSVVLAHTVTNHPVDLTVPITHAGTTLKEVYATPRADEVSLRNNSVLLKIQGVRNRLRVLLVSGVPNQGARVWRQLLKADPSVDLIHFTILRSPETEDDTPLSDLALIPFPTHELFEQKINSFDLIILDGFRNQGILPESYLRNISHYVRQGGALLVTAGPELTQTGSLQDTPLSDILPAHVPPDNGVVTRAFRPRLTAQGEGHPVTSGLPLNGPWGKEWGPWFRYLKPDSVQGESLLSTPDGTPLLVLSHQGQGRVAMLLSDQIWLWSRGEQGGGPQKELLRRLAHWLMKEPDLEENRLDAHIEHNQLIVERHLITRSPPLQADIMSPSGQHHSLTLVPQATYGLLRGVLPLPTPDTYENRIWTIRQNALVAFAAAPEQNPLEDSDLRSTAKILSPLVTSSHGGLFWIGTNTLPTIRQVAENTSLAGSDWAGLPIHQEMLSGASKTTPLLPAWSVLLGVLCLLALGWWREGR
ncbi:VWA domain-containing protein [Saccharibacter sp. 17.LH.SD]|uniref:VWA domain-containing protein n=1 Tax=Saccharibacter sp. 17.LH.SD TaxID=2689393 RepID=UPI00136E194A|nr:VWA domain-containing protein [Saccharibacter sp. 17.LH.SD]MXV44801.1 VWA domain-containing protein [Saccharibacter sp. 17.LH.SD]